MSKRKDIDFIQDIKESIERIISYTCNVEYESFILDNKIQNTKYKIQNTVIRNIEIIGEATKALSEEMKMNNSDILWKNIAGTRDKLIHDYFGVNIDII